MTLAWILYSLLIGTLIAGAARLLEGMVRIAGRPVRWVWAGALALTIALAAMAPQRTTRISVSSDILERAKIADGSVSLVTSSWRERLVAGMRTASLVVVAPVERALGAVERRVPANVGRSLGMLSLSVSALLIVLLGVVYARFRRLRREWPVAELLGERVRVSPQAGPAVVGLSRPEIVIPSWLLRRTADEQRLVLVHEREHVRARDPLLLASACVVAALMPWHPGVWWMLSRLRLAVELDCDVRVLRRGVEPRPYGTLLIDLAERCSGLRIGAPALADTSSHLEQRLLAMNSTSSRYPLLRAGALGTLALVALVAACEAKLPTSADVENMNVAGAEEGARKMQMLGGGDATYYIDGSKATAAQANALSPEQIGSIEVSKQDFADGRPTKAEIHIRTRQPGEVASGMKMRHESHIALVDGGGSNKAVAEKGELLAKERKFDGIVIIDGVRASSSAMNALNPSDILSIEIVKGDNATKLYPAPEAANGVIKITTKKSASK
jgi:beta-lactamase regulating signal transducer with metallopeptidase domain